MTGSAVMTVIDGLARWSAHGTRHRVMVAAGTYTDRYEAADVTLYRPGPPLNQPARLVDAAFARAGLGRPIGAREYTPALAAVPEEAHTLLLHNAPGTGLRAPSQSAPILYAHNEILPGPRWASGRSLRGFEGIIAVSDWLADRIRRRVPPRMRERVATVTNGVDTDAFAPVDRAARGGLRILFVGRVIPDKGPDVLLDAVARAELPGATVRIVGSPGFALEGPLSRYEASLRTRASQLASTVEFVPFTPRAQLPSHYEWADIVALPSRWDEPCGLTLLESLASGAATVISDSGGMPEVAGNAAVVVPRGDPVQLADVLRHLGDSAQERQSLGNLGRRRALEFTWRGRAERLDSVLAGWGLPSGGYAPAGGARG